MLLKYYCDLKYLKYHLWHQVSLFYDLDTELPIPESDQTLEGAVGGEVDHHASQEHTDLESDSKGDL